MPQPGVAEFLIIALIFLIVAGVAFLIVRGLRAGRPAPTRDPALDTLRTRLAAGEIDDAEYERLRHVLQRR
jgi:uncharacterized membrane protein